MAFTRMWSACASWGESTAVATTWAERSSGPTPTEDAEILIADMALGRPGGVHPVCGAARRPYAGDPSVAGSAHIALITEDIEAEYHRSRSAGVWFHTPVRIVNDPGKPSWRVVLLPRSGRHMRRTRGGRPVLTGHRRSGLAVQILGDRLSHRLEGPSPFHIVGLEQREAEARMRRAEAAQGTTQMPVDARR